MIKNKELSSPELQDTNNKRCQPMASRVHLGRQGSQPTSYTGSQHNLAQSLSCVMCHVSGASMARPGYKEVVVWVPQPLLSLKHTTPKTKPHRRGLLIRAHCPNHHNSHISPASHTNLASLPHTLSHPASHTHHSHPHSFSHYRPPLNSHFPGGRAMLATYPCSRKAQHAAGRHRLSHHQCHL